LLAIYEDLCDRLRTAKAAVREAQKHRKPLSKGFWKDQVEAILHFLGETGRRTPVTPTLVEHVAHAAPAQGALGILAHVFGRSPDYLRREFAALRNTRIE
jgi:hypothetical protein